MRVMRLGVSGATAGALLIGAVLPLGGQVRADARWAGSHGDERPATLPAPVQVGDDDDEGSYLGLAKWSALAISAGATIYGFRVNAQADDEFQEIDAICTRDPERCRTRAPDGAFADPELEARYQEVLDKDRSARATLILAQVGLATTIVLFVLDLDGSETPPDIPFDPPRVSVSPDRAWISWSVALPFH